MRSDKIKWNKFKYESQMECMLCNRQFHEKSRYIRITKQSILLAGRHFSIIDYIYNRFIKLQLTKKQIFLFFEWVEF